MTPWQRRQRAWRRLRTLRRIADKHHASVATVASHYILQKRQVAAAILGMRHAGHLSDTHRIFDFELNEEDLAAIHRITDRAAGLEGDVYSLERIKGGKHGAIMKYNLSKE